MKPTAYTSIGLPMEFDENDLRADIDRQKSKRTGLPVGRRLDPARIFKPKKKMNTWL